MKSGTLRSQTRDSRFIRSRGPGWKPGSLRLADGSAFPGSIPTDQTDLATGEVVFSTGMTGYVESLTDPSYAGQILCFTYPLIGNYGVPSARRWESGKIHARGVIVSSAITEPSHSDSEMGFLEWVRAQNVPIISGVDTRALTKHLRDQGSTLGAITNGRRPKELFDPNTVPMVPEVSPSEPRLYDSQKRKRVILVDCGAKENIARLLSDSVRLKRVPYDYDYSKEPWDGVVVSNGPGNPAQVPETIKIIRKAFAKKRPMFGICLGTQLLARAAGANTHKLRFGHRGHNQPVQSTSDGRAFITSQNHGFAVSEKSLPKEWEVTYRNLNDGSVEGIAHKQLPFSAVQFHPEAAPGPTDTRHLLTQFVSNL